MSNPGKSIILFDGECNFCNHFVPFIIGRDPKSRFLLGSLQSPPGQRLLCDHGLDPANLSTMVLIEGSTVYTRSTAALRIARRLKFPWPVLSIFLLIPRLIRDRVYRFIARRRYRWFGRSDFCAIPTPQSAARFVK